MGRLWFARRLRGIDRRFPRMRLCADDIGTDPDGRTGPGRGRRNKYGDCMRITKTGLPRTNTLDQPALDFVRETKPGIGAFARQIDRAVEASPLVQGPSALEWLNGGIALAKRAVRLIEDRPRSKDRGTETNPDSTSLLGFVRQQAKGSPHPAEAETVKRLLYLLAKVQHCDSVGPLPRALVEALSGCSDTLGDFLASHEVGSHRGEKKLPALRPHDMDMWRASQVAGKSQTEIAAMFSVKLGIKVKQPRVSEAIARAQAHAEASGAATLVDSVLKKPGRCVSLDPRSLDIGLRGGRNRASGPD